MISHRISQWVAAAAVLVAGICLSSCADKEDPAVYLTVELSRSELQNGAYYAVAFDERSLELEFSHPLDTSTVRGNITFYDKDGPLDSCVHAVCFDRKLILEFIPGFEMEQGWQYKIGISTGLRSTTGETLPAPGVIDIRTSGPPVLAGMEPDTRNCMVCISDLHMGEARAVDGHYCWFSENAAALENLLDSVLASSSVRQLVILGDLFDEWIVPYRMQPFDNAGGIFSSEDYFRSVANSPVNAPIVDRLKAIAASGTIQLIYVPGNHDMLLTQPVLEEIIPGVIWKGKTGGVGDFSPVDEIIAEHGHRFDLFNCPQPLVNPGHILPPGYFISRLQAEGLWETGGGKAGNLKSSAGSLEFLIAWTSAYAYVVADYSMKVHPDSVNILMGGIDAYSTPFSFNGARDMYAASIETVWNATQAQNGVPVPLPVIAGLLDGGIDLYPAVSVEYLSAGTPRKFRMAVLGHTHRPELDVYPPGKDYSGIYANTGSWVNASLCKYPVRTYLVVWPGAWTGSDLDVVSLYQYNPGIGGQGYMPVLLDEESIERKVSLF